MNINSIKTKDRFHNFIRIKQLDNTSPIEVLLCDSTGALLSGLNEKCTVSIYDAISREVRQVSDEQIVDGVLSFKIVNDLLPCTHKLEVTTFSGVKFPADDDFQIFVSESHNSKLINVIKSIPTELALKVVTQQVMNRFNSISDNFVNYIKKGEVSVNDLNVKEGKITEGYIAEELINSIRQSETLSKENQSKFTSYVKKGEVTVGDIDKNKGLLDASFFSSAFLSQLKGGTISATNVLDGAITTVKLADKSVVAEKTNFIKLSTNLIDKNKYINGKKLDTTNGTLVDSSTIVTLEKVYDVRPGENYTSANTNARCFYGSSGTFISGFSGNSSFTIPDNVYKMKISVAKTALPTAQLNRGSNLLSYEDYFKPYIAEEYNPLTKGSVSHDHLQLQSVSADNLSFIKYPDNLIYIDGVKEGATISAATGEETTNSTTAVSDFEKVSANEDYTISKVSRVLFYDTNKKYLGLFYEAQLDTKTYTTPANAYYYRYVIHKTNYSVAQMNKSSTLLPYSEWHEPYLDITSKSALNVNVTKDDKFMFDLPIDRRYSTDAVFADYKSQSDKTAAEMYQLFDDLYNQYPQYFKEKKLLGNDDFGNPITYYYVSTKQAETTVSTKRPLYLITCGTHGFEKISTAVVYETFKNAFANWKTDEGLETLLFNADFIIVPVVNPSGWNAFTRKNGNGVDLNRNFGTKDWSGGDPSSSTYGGTAPFSEKESQYIKYLFDNFKFNSVIDFHNFHSSPTNNHVWIVANGDHQLIAQKTINRLFRQWQNKFDFLPPNTILGYTSTQSGGLIANYGLEHGAELASTFEVCWRWLIDSNSVNYDDNAIRTGVEALVNYILMQFSFFEKTN